MNRQCEFVILPISIVLLIRCTSFQFTFFFWNRPEARHGNNTIEIQRIANMSIELLSRNI